MNFSLVKGNISFTKWYSLINLDAGCPIRLTVPTEILASYTSVNPLELAVKVVCGPKEGRLQNYVRNYIPSEFPFHVPFFISLVSRRHSSI